MKYLTADEEGMLVDYLLKCAEIGYGKTRRDVCCLVESYLQIKDKKHSDRQLSNGWWEKFIRHNSSLHLQGIIPVSTSPQSTPSPSTTSHNSLLTAMDVVSNSEAPCDSVIENLPIISSTAIETSPLGDISTHSSPSSVFTAPIVQPLLIL